MLGAHMGDEAVSRCNVGALIVTALAATMMSFTAAAQVADDVSEADAVEEIVVTGSRIKKRNLFSTSPVTQVDAEEFTFQGVTRVEDLLNDLPQVIADQSSGTNNGSDGIATVDLRGLQPTRTLTLLNGRRLPAGSPAAPVADVNQIPGMMIERVEVLTGGASATYGSDALSGVVNFITIRDFEGLQFDYQFGQYQHDNGSSVAQLVTEAGFDLPASSVRDGDTHTFSLMLGINDGGDGNLTAYATYREIEPVVQSQRDYSACALNAGPDAGGAFCGGSSTIPDGRFTDFGLLTNPDCVLVSAPTPEDPNAMACNRVPQFNYATGTPTGAVDDDGNLVMMNEPVLPWYGNTSGSGDMPWPGRFDFLVDPGTDTFANRGGHPDAFYNFGPTNLLMRPDERFTFGILGYRRINDSAEIYLELNYMDDKTVAQLAPSGSFFWPDTVSCDNPLLSQQQFDLLCTQYNLTAADSQVAFIGRRNIEGGPRTSDLNHTSARGVLGVRGDIGTTWSYDAYLNYGQVEFSSVFDEDLSITNMVRAIDVVVDPLTGQPVCASALSGADPECVPWNVFETGAVTQEAIDYITLPIFYVGSTEQIQTNAYVTADLGDYGIVLPTADEGIKVVLGLEYREERLDYIPDKTAQEGGAAGQGSSEAPVSGRYTVNEFFTEASIPLIEGKTGAELVSLDLGYRYSDYSTGKKTDTYKFAGDWMMHTSLRLRASFQHAVRVGNIHELFEPLRDGGGTNRDTCEGPDPVSTFEQCQNTGVSAAQYGNIVEDQSNFGSSNTRFGGNPDLDPEESDTLSFGFIFTPAFLPDLTLSADYFDIEVTGAISDANPQFIFNQCIETGAAQFCDAVNRDPTTALLWLGEGHIVAPKTNIGFLRTTGVDITAAFGFDIGRYGDISLNLIGTYVDKWDTQELPGAPIVECLGVYISLTCGRARPEWASNLRTTWTTPWDASVSLLWRYVGDLKDESGFGNHLPSTNYVDLSGVWQVTDSIGVRIGMMNILDEDPPIASFGSGNTLPEVYDAMGRYWFTGFTFRL